MNPGRAVSVVPATVEPVLARMRECSLEYAAAAGRLGKGMPRMPPWCLAQTQLAVDGAAARLLGLAARADFVAVSERRRVASLVGAGGGDVGATVRVLGADLGGEASRVAGDLQEQPGLTISPVVGAVHTLSGAADVLAADWRLFQMAGAILPINAATNPVEAATARQQLLAMGLNVVRMTPDWGAVDPVGHNQAFEGLLARTIDARDLRSGDLARWQGHIGLGLVLGLVTRGAGDEEAVVAADSPAAGAGDAVRTGIEAVDTINRIPGANEDPGYAPTASMVRRVEDAFRGLFGRVTPSP